MGSFGPAYPLAGWSTAVNPRGVLQRLKAGIKTSLEEGWESSVVCRGLIGSPVAKTSYEVHLMRLNGKRLLRKPKAADKLFNLILEKLEELDCSDGFLSGEVVGRNRRTEGLESFSEIVGALELEQRSGGAKELVLSFSTPAGCSLLLQAYSKPLERVVGSTLSIYSNTPTTELEWRRILARCGI